MLNFVLFCSGKGSDPNAYRPHRDDSQWWGRRDAQARCVSAALYGPPPSSSSSFFGSSSTTRRHQSDEQQRQRRQVVFLYSEDLALLRMIRQEQQQKEKNRCDHGSSSNNNCSRSSRSMGVCSVPTVPLMILGGGGGGGNKGRNYHNKCFFAMPSIPTESNLVRVWKKAALHPIKSSSSSSVMMRTRAGDHTDDDVKESMYCFMETESWCHSNTTNNNNDNDKGKQLVVPKYTQKEIENMNKRTLLHEIQELLKQYNKDSQQKEEETQVLEYLRKWRLNSSQDVVLRKVNQKTMQLAYWDLVSLMTTKMKIGQEGERGGKGEDKHVDSIGLKDNKRKIGNDSVTKEIPMDKDVYNERLHKTLCHVLTSHHVMSDNKEVSNESQSATATTTTKSMDAIAIYLHETCPLELPVFGNDILRYTTKQQLTVQLGDDAPPPPSSCHHVYVFLGAVRDITQSEYIVLQRACQTMNVPLVGCHLGPVAEFTSKIVTAVAFHSHVGILNKAVKDLYREVVVSKSVGVDQMLLLEENCEEDGKTNRAGNKRRKCGAATTSTITNIATNTIHTICMVPFPIQLLSCELQHRNQHMWNLVRVCVASLWRSKVASASSLSSPLTSSAPPSLALDNKLTLYFQCGHTMHLNPNDLVLSLAEKHQAAPTEHQILKALCEKIPTCINDDDNNKNDLCALLDINCNVDKAIAMDFTSWHTASHPQDSAATGKVDDDSKKDWNFIAKVYAEKCACNTKETDELIRRKDEIKCHYLISIINLSNQIQEQRGQQHERLLNHIQHTLGIPVIDHHGPLMVDTQPHQRGDSSIGILDASVTITMLQHFAYHSRLFQVLTTESFSMTAKAEQQSVIVQKVGTRRSNSNNKNKSRKKNKQRKEKKVKSCKPRRKKKRKKAE